MTTSCRASLISAVALVLTATAHAATQTGAIQSLNQNSNEPAAVIPTGRVVASVACRAKPEQTYALYLPSSFTADKTWPLIAAFDPAARGNLPVESFKEAAERYGYIVCGSNNSRNGPWAPTVEAANAMLNDVSTRFPISEKRVYLAGFSGGARVASQFAVMLQDRVAGVIGSGAGLAFGLEPTQMRPYAYYGTIGAEDFNFPEMKQLDRLLDAATVAHRLEIFDGDHGWAPSASYVRAVEWLELQAMKSGSRSRDEAFIERLFTQARQELATHESSGRQYEAYFAAAAISADFKGLRDVAEFERKLEALKGTKPVKTGLKRDRDQETEQMRRGTELFAMRGRLRNPAVSAALSGADSPSGAPQSNPGNSLDAADERQLILADLRNKLAALRRASQAKENTTERVLARRILNQYLISQFEQVNALIRSKKYDLAVTDLATEAELQPENPRVLYTLARASALKGDKRRALDALNKAVQKGFTSVAELERNHDLDSIRDDDQFKKIVESLRSKG